MKYLCDDCGKKFSAEGASLSKVFVSPGNDKTNHPKYRIEVKVQMAGHPIWVYLCKDCLTKRLLEALK